MTSVSTVNCPRCQLALVEFADASIRSCSNCEGVLLSRRAMMSLLERMSDGSEVPDESGDVLTSLPDDVAKTPAGSCPQCRELMECFGYLGSRDLFIDGCAKCNSIWTDGDELTSMVVLYERSKMANEEINDARRKSDADSLEFEIRRKIRQRVYAWNCV